MLAQNGCAIARDARHDGDISLQGLPAYRPWAPGTGLGPLWKQQMRSGAAAFQPPQDEEASGSSSSSDSSNSGSSSSSSSDSPPQTSSSATKPKAKSAAKAKAKQKAKAKAKAKRRQSRKTQGLLALLILLALASSSRACAMRFGSARSYIRPRKLPLNMFSKASVALWMQSKIA